MNSEEVKRKLMLFFKNNLLYNESMDEIEEDESLIQDGYIDSTGIIELVSFIEMTFGFKVFDREILPENFDSIKRIHNYVCGKVAS